MSSLRQRPFNFGAGPAALPEEVLLQAAGEMLDWQGCGMGVMEMSHRGSEFIAIYENAIAGLRILLDVPQEFHILFLQGGGIGENAIVPLNLSGGGVADFLLTGSWSRKSWDEARRYVRTAHVAASAESGGLASIPPASSWHLSSDAAYVHVCSNETIQGVQFAELPDLAALGSLAPLVVDCSSDIASRRFDWQRVGLAFAGAQKNLGPAGLTVVFVRDELLGRALPICPSAFNYELAARHQSMYNTPPPGAFTSSGSWWNGCDASVKANSPEWLRWRSAIGDRPASSMRRSTPAISTSTGSSRLHGR